MMDASGDGLIAEFEGILKEITAAGPVLAAAGLPRVAEALALWEAGATLDAALQLPAGWRNLVRLARRNAALLHLSATIRAPSDRARAAAMVSMLHRYEGSTFQHDRRAGRRPEKDKGALYDVLMLGDAPAASTIRAVLSKRNG